MNTLMVVRNKAFTLVELLTVIAIIGILAAIIIPTVGKVRSSAKQAQCLSNIRQIAMAQLMYASDDKNGRIAVGSSNPRYWFLEIRPYLGYKVVAYNLAPIFLCPSDSSRGAAESETNDTRRRSYGVNGSFQSGTSDPDGTALSIPITSVERPPSKVVMVGEIKWWVPELVTNYVRNTAQFLDHVSREWHNQKCSLAFLDGHAASYEIESLYPGKENNELFETKYVVTP